jgi:putative nucleotidyltransferase with HDIG domain
MLENPNVSAAELAKVIKSDQSISTKVLKLVNSAFYGLSGKVGTICQGIVILGFNTVRNIILSVSVFDLLPKNEDYGEFEIAKFWEHSIGCAVISKVFAQRLGLKDPEEAFIAGLLHDIGKVVIAKLFQEDFLTILKTTHKERVLFLDVEQEVLEITHSQVGGILAKHWKLPNNLTEAISFHHDCAEKMDNPKLVSVIHLADIITRGLQIGSGGDRVIPEINNAAWDVLKMDTAIIERWIDDIDEEVEKASAFFSVLSG